MNEMNSSKFETIKYRIDYGDHSIVNAHYHALFKFWFIDDEIFPDLDKISVAILDRIS